MDFDWKELGKKLAGLGLPLLGGALGGPGGAAVGSLIASTLGTTDDPKAIFKHINLGPGEHLKLREIETRHVEFLTKAYYDAEMTVIGHVNTTMQAESRSEHWAQWAWRPYVGFCFGTTWFGNYFVLPLFKLEPTTIPTEAWLAVGGILGVASWWRGKAKTEVK